MKFGNKSTKWMVRAAWATALAAFAMAATPACFAQLYRVAPQNGQTAVQGPATNAPGARQQTPAQAPNAAASTLDIPRGGDLILGPGDVIQIQVANDADISGKYLISQSGDIRIPTIPNAIHATDLSTTQLSDRISKALVQAQILKDPVVSIFVDEYHSHTVTVVGQVQKPGIYPVEVNTTVLQAITEAGGLLTTAGSSVTVTRAKTGAQSNAGPGHVEPASDQSTVETLTVADMVAGRNGAANTLVHAGDVVNVGTAPIVYVVGAVTRPGAFAIQSNNSEITVLQALALVEGVTSVASAKKAIIVRNSTDPKGRKEIPVNIPKMMSGKEPDQYLAANDILFIPESGLKKSLHRMGDVAIGAATEVAGYGSALRVAAF